MSIVTPAPEESPDDQTENQHRRNQGPSYSYRILPMLVRCRSFQSSYGGGFGTGGFDEVTANGSGHKSQHNGEPRFRRIVHVAMPGTTKMAITPPNTPGIPWRLCTPQVSTTSQQLLQRGLDEGVAHHTDGRPPRPRCTNAVSGLRLIAGRADGDASGQGGVGHVAPRATQPSAGSTLSQVGHQRRAAQSQDGVDRRAGASGPADATALQKLGQKIHNTIEPSMENWSETSLLSMSKSQLRRAGQGHGQSQPKVGAKGVNDNRAGPTPRTPWSRPGRRPAPAIR